MEKTKKLVINWDGEDSFEVFYGKKSLGSGNHDDHGWNAMSAMTSLVEHIGEALNIPVENRY